MEEHQTSRPKALKIKLRPVKRLAISDEIIEQIISLMERGDLEPGQRLPSERELCKVFAASRSSIREALRCLSIMGVLTTRVGEGTSVAVDGGKFLGKIVQWRLITEQHDIENLMEVRVALEGVAAENMARSGSEADIAKLESLLEKMSGALTDEKRFGALDLDFHLEIARGSKNTLLFDLVTVIRGQLMRGLTRVLPLPNALPLSYKEHAAITRAIKQRNPEAARERMQAHLQAAIGRYRRENQGKQPGAVAVKRALTANVKTSATTSRRASVHQ